MKNSALCCCDGWVLVAKPFSSRSGISNTTSIIVQDVEIGINYDGEPSEKKVSSFTDFGGAREQLADDRMEPLGLQGLNWDNLTGEWLLSAAQYMEHQLPGHVVFWNMNTNERRCDSKHTSALGLFLYADAYKRSAQTLEAAKIQAGYQNSPVYFLYSHAIELYLKSFLRSFGVCPKKLANRNHFGHDFVKLMEGAEQYGLSLPSRESQILKKWAMPSELLKARYFETGARLLPNLDELGAVCQTVYLSVVPKIVEVVQAQNEEPNLPNE